MSKDDTLSTYPYVLVRIACTDCNRQGSYRLARLAAKFGPEAKLEDVLARLASDCPHWRPRHPVREGCKARFVDLS